MQITNEKFLIENCDPNKNNISPLNDGQIEKKNLKITKTALFNPRAIEVNPFSAFIQRTSNMG